MVDMMAAVNLNRVQPAALDNTDQGVETQGELCQTLKRRQKVPVNLAHSNQQIQHTPATRPGGRSVMQHAHLHAIQALCSVDRRVKPLLAVHHQQIVTWNWCLERYLLAPPHVKPDARQATKGIPP